MGEFHLVEDLTVDQVAQLMANAVDAGRELDRMVDTVAAHRHGCRVFGCHGGEIDMDGYGLHQLAQLLAVALNRLAERTTP